MHGNPLISPLAGVVVVVLVVGLILQAFRQPGRVERVSDTRRTAMNAAGDAVICRVTDHWLDRPRRDNLTSANKLSEPTGSFDSSVQ